MNALRIHSNSVLESYEESSASYVRHIIDKWVYTDKELIHVY